MTAQINRLKPFVNKQTGHLTQYGWSVLQDVWRATGGATAIDGDETNSIVSAAPLVPVVRPAFRPAWAVMSVQGGSSAEGTVDATPRKIAAWNTNGIEKNMVADHSGDDITANFAGTYWVSATLSFTGTAAKQLDVEIYVSGAASGFAASRMLDAAGAVEALAIGGLVALKAADTVEVYQSTPDVSLAMTVTEAQLTAVRVDD